MVRVVERPSIERPEKASHLDESAAPSDNLTRLGQLSGAEYQRRRDAAPPFTVRWDPGCDCEGCALESARVLDPFAGAGTTALAALRKGRSFVGVEFNTAYADMAKRRLDDELGRLLVDTTIEPAADGASTDLLGES